jgi:hypothetical protein
LTQCGSDQGEFVPAGFDKPKLMSVSDVVWAPAQIARKFREGGFVGEDASQSFLRSKRSNAPQFAKPDPECAYVIAREHPRETVGRPARELAKTTPGADGGSKIGNPSHLQRAIWGFGDTKGVKSHKISRTKKGVKCEVIECETTGDWLWEPLYEQLARSPKYAYFFSS